MILEGIVTTLSPEGAINIAPMGPHVGPAMERFVLRPYHTAQTYRNLKAHGEGVLHVTDDVLLLARAAIGPVEPVPALLPATRIRGAVLADCCRYYEFRATSFDDREERARIDVEVLHWTRVRDFFGFNRGKHAVLEAAILATRTEFLPLEEIQAEYRKLALLVHKTGGEQEIQAFELLQRHVEEVQRRRLGKGGTVHAPE
jgi:hypothetical protein